MLHYAEVAFRRRISDVETWNSVLTSTDEHFPKVTTAPVTAHPEGASPCGAVDMVGNAWEYTYTNAYSRLPLTPVFKNFEPAQIMSIGRAHVIIKGGAWSSIPNLTSGVFPGKDLLTDRHFEIGFRCVFRPG